MQLTIILEANLKTLTSLREEYTSPEHLRELRSSQVGAFCSLLHMMSECDEFTEEQQVLFSKMCYKLTPKLTEERPTMSEGQQGG